MGCNRWVIAAAGVVVMATTGTLYAWAIFTQPLLVAFRWDVTIPTCAYAVANFCVASVGALIGGYWQDKAGPRRVAVTGVALWGVGNFLAGWGTTVWGAPWLYLSYGLIGGIGAGMAYITPVSMVTKWFPERKGFAGGLIAGGFGLGAFVYNQTVPRLSGFHTAASHAASSIVAQAAATMPGAAFARATLAGDLMTDSDLAAVMHVFMGSGLAYLFLGLIAASLFRNPPAAPFQTGRNTGRSPSEILRMRQFYLLWLQLFINVLAGITIISNAVMILEDLTHEPIATLAFLFGWVSLFNAVGRLFWGAVSDRIGSQHTFATMFAIQAMTLLWLSGVHQLPLALAGFAIILLCCGGGFGVMPCYSADCFGTKFMGMNYALILSAWGFAGVAGPLLIARAKDLNGSFEGVLPMIAAVLFVAIILPFLTNAPPLGTSTPGLPGGCASEVG